jgi:uncharacterized protein (TIGR02246 family)
MTPENYDETTVRELHARMIDAWNHGSAADFSRAFSEQADFIAFEGTHLKGRSAVEKFHQRLFDTELKNTRLEGGVHFVRFLGPTLAVMHSWVTTTLAGQTNASSSRDSMQLFVAVKRGDQWQFEAMLNARRVSMEQQLFADQFEALSPGDQREVTHKVASLRH